MKGNSLQCHDVILQNRHHSIARLSFARLVDCYNAIFEFFALGLVNPKLILSRLPWQHPATRLRVVPGAESYTRSLSPHRRGLSSRGTPNHRPVFLPVVKHLRSNSTNAV